MNEPVAEVLRLYGSPSEEPPLSWAWVDRELAGAGTYWMIGRSDRHPHARPVWGVWHDGALHLSVGSPVLARELAADPAVTVHLGSGTDVVVVEGEVVGPTEDEALIAGYNEKYTWDYVVADYGPLTSIRPETVLAWRSAGWAGREGFQETGRWRFPPSP